jgi:hypothetical protein
MQRSLNAARWYADAVRDDLMAYVVEHLADPQFAQLDDEFRRHRVYCGATAVTLTAHLLAGENCLVPACSGSVLPPHRP